MMMDCALCSLWNMECSICGVNKKSKGSADKGVGSGICVDVGGAEEEGVVVSGGAKVVGTSDLLPLAVLGPLNVTVGSSRFQ